MKLSIKQLRLLEDSGCKWRRLPKKYGSWHTIEILYREVNFNDVDLQAKHGAKKDWKRFKEIVSLAKDTVTSVAEKKPQ